MSDTAFPTAMSAGGRAIWALVPTKELAYAKSRLSPLLDPAQRRGLVVAMLNDVLATLLTAPGLAGVAVVGRDPVVREVCRTTGALLLHDTSASLNASLTEGAQQLLAIGAGALLVVPGDVPLVTHADIAALTEALHAGAGLALAPAHDGGGTNGLGLRLPSLFTFQFGLDSFALHLAQAQRLGITTHIYRSPTLGLDIDTAADLQLLEEYSGAPATQALLRDMCVQHCAA